MATHSETTRTWLLQLMYCSLRLRGLTLDPTNCDPISGSPEHRANLCQVKLVQPAAA